MLTHWRRQQNMHRHIFPIVVDSEVRWHSVCNVYLFFCGVIKWRRASAGALAPAAGHEPARILNHRRLLAGALAQRLQHVCIIIQYMCVVIQRYRKCPGALAPTTGHAPARIPNHRRLLAGALAQRLQHVGILVRYMCALLRDTGQVPAH